MIVASVLRLCGGHWTTDSRVKVCEKAAGGL